MPRIKSFIWTPAKRNSSAAPKFDTAKWEEDTQSNRVSEVYGYYGQQPYFTRDGYENHQDDAALANSLPRNMDGTINTAGGRPAETAHYVEVARNVEEQKQQCFNPQPGWDLDPDILLEWERSKIFVVKLGLCAEGEQAHGHAGEEPAGPKTRQGENLMVDVSAGRIVAVIISSGGYLGLGDELSAVPPTSLRFNTQHDNLQLDASKEMLTSSPHFKANQWPDFTQPGYAGEVYHAYGVEPYFNTETTTAADNTGQNVRDRNNRTLTPLDQGNNQADLNTTAPNSQRNHR